MGHNQVDNAHRLEHLHKITIEDHRLEEDLINHNLHHLDKARDQVRLRLGRLNLRHQEVSIEVHNFNLLHLSISHKYRVRILKIMDRANHSPGKI